MKHYKTEFTKIKSNTKKYSRTKLKYVIMIASILLLTLGTWVFDSNIMTTLGILFFIDYLSYNIGENIGKNITINNAIILDNLKKE